MIDTIIKVIGIVFPVVGTIIVAFIEKNAAKERTASKTRNDKAEELAKLREKESRLSMQMLDATLQLSIVEANALTGRHNNGNVAKAREAAQDAQSAYKDFLEDIAVRQINRRI